MAGQAIKYQIGVQGSCEPYQSLSCSAGDPIADWNDDGTVNTQDILEFLNIWNAGC
jgi:hypothetical protein